LRDLAEDRQRRRDRVEGEERLERVEVDLAARQRAQLRRERELAGVGAVVERLDPVAVAREHEPRRGASQSATANIPRSRSRTPGRSARRGGRAPRCRVRAEAVAGALELGRSSR
jgi:hypothetical protein